MRELIVPGEMIAESPEQSKGTFIEAGKTYSAVLGLYDSETNRLIPLKGAYIPQADEFVIGVVEEARFSSYNIDIGSVYKGYLSAKEVREDLKVGDVVAARVSLVDEVRNVDLTEPRLLSGGEVIAIPAVKVPRVIGKEGSMLKMLEQATGCQILVGKNGRIWISGQKPDLAVTAVLKIEREAHTSGLTDRMKAFLEKGGA